MKDLMYEQDKKAIQKTSIIALLVYIVVLGIIFFTGNSMVGEMLEIKEYTFIHMLSFDMLILGCLGLGISIVMNVGAVSNYTDCFRVRRGYGYEIRKECINRYAPSFALVVTSAKFAAMREEIDKDSFSIVYFLFLYAAIYLFYMFFIGIFVIWAGFIYHYVLLIGAAVIPIVLFWSTLMSVGEHMIFLHYDSVKLAIGCAIVFGMGYYFSLKALKRHMMRCDMLGY